MTDVTEANAQSREQLFRNRLAAVGGASRTGFARVERSGVLRLGGGQAQMWVLNQLAPDSLEYVVPLVLRIGGAVDADALARAWRFVCGRHEILRSVYALVDGEPAQMVGDELPADPAVTDLRDTPERGRQARVRAVVSEELARPFDLRVDLPVRGRLVRVGDAECVLVVVFHHIACDADATGVFAAELAAAYEAELAGEEPRLPPVDLQYADYTAWQRNRALSAQGQTDLAYWRTRLAGVTPTALPYDRPRPAIREHAGAVVRFEIPAELAGRVRAVAVSCGTTPFAVLLTAWQVLLARYAGVRDVAVGTVMSGRHVPELRGMIGYCIDSLVLRGRWTAGASFEDLVRASAGTVLEAYDHQHIPFARLVDELEPERDLSRTPLYQVAFTMHEERAAGLVFAGVQAEVVDADAGVAKCDLALQVSASDGGAMRAGLVYATSLFDSATVERFSRHLRRLLERCTANPGTDVDAIEVLDAEERVLTADAGKASARDSVPVTLLPSRFEHHAALAPDAVAVLAGGREWTYLEVNAAGNRLAHHLRGLGVGPETSVGVCLGRDGFLLPALLGVLKAGAGYVPLDPAVPAERLAYIAGDSGVGVVVTTTALAGHVREALGSGTTLVSLDTDVLEASPDTDPEPVAVPENLAYTIYTSGSTGRPKGVRVTHANVARLIATAQQHYGITATDVVSMTHSFAFDVSVFEMWAALSHGARLVLVPEEVSRVPAELLALLAEQRVSVLSQTPSAFSGLVAAAEAGDPVLDELSLRTVIFAGEKLQTDKLGGWAARVSLDRTVLANMYGITETTVHAAYHRVQQRDLEPGAPNRIGRGLSDLRLRLLDADLRPVPAGVAGEICVAGPGVARGYSNPAMTAARFVPDPFGPPGSRLYRSGDLARRSPDGSLEFLGRADAQVKVRGYRIEPGEIEAVLAAHPAVGQAAVIARDAGGSGAVLTAYVVPANNAVPAPAELAAHCAAALPEYMVPAAFVTLPELPLTVNGKLDRAALPAPGRADLRAGADYTPARTPAELAMTGIWQHALSLERIGVHDGFFDLGGDSIKAIALVGTLRAQGFDVTVRDIFEHRTIADLTAHAATRAGSVVDTAPVAPFQLIDHADRALLPSTAIDAYPLGQNQTGMLVEMLASGGASAGTANLYHNVSTFPINDAGGFSEAAFRAALDALARRHEVLRTSLHLTGFSVPMQIVHDSAHLSLGVRDLRGLDPQAVAAAVAEYTVAERARPLDPAVPGLLRFFVQVTDGGFQLAVTECHAILEGWSHHSLVMEVLGLHRELRDGLEPETYQSPEVRFADFIAAEQAALASAVDRTFWQDVVRTTAPFTVPVGWGDPGAGAGTVTAATVWSDLEPRLRDLAAVADASLKSVLLAAFTKVTAQLTPEAAVRVGLVCDTRPELLGADRVPGMYLNTVPFPVDRTAASWRDLVRRVHGLEADLWPHRRYPLPAIIRDNGAGSRLFEAYFNYQDFHQVDTGLIGIGGVDDSPTEFPLTVSTRAGHVFVTADPRTVSGAAAERVAAMFRAVLEAMATDPDGDAHAVFLPEDDVERMLAQGSQDTEVGEPVATLLEVFAARVSADAGAAAVTSRQSTLTYGEVDARANRLAHRLVEMGAGPERLVGVCLRRDELLIPGLLGVLKSGSGYLPLDPAAPSGRLGGIVRDAGAVAVVTVAALAPEVRDFFGGPVLVLDDPQEAERIAAAPASAPVVPVEPDGLAYSIYTSGSTGVPKGVLVTHRNVARLITTAREHYGFDDADVVSMTHNYAFDVSVFEIWAALAHGARLVLVEAETARSPQDLLDLLVAERVTILSQTPSAFRSLVSAARDDDPRVPAIALRAVVFAGEKLDVPLLKPWVERRGLDRTALVNMYGITETTVHTTYHRIAGPDLAEGAGNPIGSPLRDLKVYLVDAELRLVPAGVVGEICVAGPGVARGYRGARLTAERFVPDPFGAPGSRMYRSGDLARRRADGTLEFLGRRDTQVKVRGYRVEPGEIEVALAAHPLVRDCLVAARDDDGSGARLVAYVVPAQAGTTPDPADLRAWLIERLPAYMVPAAYVPLAGIPLTPNGKQDRDALPAPRAEHFSRAQAVTPRNEFEAELCAVFSEVLGLDQVGVTDSFFDLGGDSLRAVALVGRLRAAGHDARVADVFGARTIAALAETLAGRDRLTEAAAGSVAPFTLIDEADRALLPPDVADAYPLTQNQIGMLAEALVSDTVNTYHIVVSFRVADDAPFDQDVFGRAVQAVVGRHNTLRTSFDLYSYSKPMQLVHRTADIKTGSTDLRGLDEAGQRAELERFFAAERDTPFDVRAGRPMLRISTHVHDDTTWRCTFAQSHALLDGWSYHLLLAEVVDVYRRLRDGLAEPPAVTPPAQYAAAVAAELQALDSAQAREYWRGVVGDNARLVLPEAWRGDTSRPAETVRAGLRFADLEPGLRVLAAQAGASMKSVLLAAHLKVLSQLTPEASFHTGLVSHTRPEVPGADRMLGMLLNTLPFAYDRSAGTWRAAVAAVFEAEARMWRHRHFPMPAIQAELGGGGRLVDAFFSYLDYQHVDLDGTSFENTGILSSTEFALEVTALDNVLTIRTDTHVMTQEFADGLARMYRAVLAAMAAGGDGDARAVYLAGAVVPVAGEVVGFGGLSVPEVIASRALGAPDAVAVVAGARQVSFGELVAGADRVVAGLRAVGVRPGSVVGVVVDRGVDLLPAMLGVWRAGAAYLPLDPGYPVRRLGETLADACAAAVVTQGSYVAGLRSVFDGPVLESAGMGDSGVGLQAAAVAVDPDSLAYVIYTSGSTGRPKGVQITHRGLANHLGWAARDLAGAGTGGSVVLSSVAFDLAVTMLWAPLLVGQPVRMLPPDMELTDLGRQLLAGAPYSFLKLTPGHLEILSQQLTPEQAAELAALVVVAGEALPGELADRWASWLGPERLLNDYGPTEASVATCAVALTAPIGSVIAPIGKALPNTVMRVLDADLRPVPVGVPGELFVTGTGLARGYGYRPALTAERFLPDPFGEPGMRMYRTGDLVRLLPDGNVDFLGRLDDQVKIRGYRIEPAEITAAIRTHPAVRDAAVIATDGEDRRLIAYVVADGRPQDYLAAFCASVLPEYMTPTAFVAVDALPLTANGKLDRAALPTVEAADVHEVVAPRSPLQERVAAIWAGVLGLERVGVTEGFFESGGDSIKAITLIGALRTGGVDAQVRDIFEHRTVAGVCEAITRREADAATGTAPLMPVAPFALIGANDRAALPADAVDAYPMSQVQVGMVVEMLADADADGSAYHSVGARPVADAAGFDADAFRVALAAVADRHEMLRTSLHLTGFSLPVQVVHAEVRIPVAVHERGADLEEVLRGEQAARFDPAAAPLVRVAVVPDADDAGRWWLSLTQPHATHEGWSRHGLIAEILSVYRDVRIGREVVAQPTGPARYADFIAAERAALDSQTDRGFWRAVVEDHETVRVPSGWAAPREPAEDFDVRIGFPELSEALARVAKQAQTSVKSVLLAAHVKVLSQLAAPGFHVGVVTDARPELPGAENVMGMHLNTLPFPVDALPDTWLALVRSVFDTEVAAWPHRQYPMPAIARLRGTGERLFEVVFNYFDFTAADRGAPADAAAAGAGVGTMRNDFPLTVNCGPAHIALSTNTHTLGRDAAERLGRVYRAVLEAICADPEGSTRRVFLSADEELLLRQWTDTAREPADLDVIAALEQQAVRHPDTLAVRDDDQAVSYGELNARANRLAHHLRGLGVGPESVVGLRTERSAEQLTAVLAVLKTGAAYIPVDPRLPEERARFLLDDAGVSTLISRHATDPVAPAGMPVVALDDPDAWAGHSADNIQNDSLQSAVDADHLAYVIYTSGSTGLPKGVLVTRRGMGNHLLAKIEDLELGAHDTIAQNASLGFDISVWQMLAALAVGGTTRVVGAAAAADPAQLFDRVARDGVSVLEVVPAVLRAALDVWDATGDTPVLPRLRRLLATGEALAPDLCARWFERFPAVPIVNAYGPTECSDDITHAILTAADDLSGPRVPIGRPVRNMRLYVLDADLLPVPVGVPGELHAGGTGVARGYMNRAALSARSFVPDPFGQAGSRLYRTGDLARWLPDGSLDFLGRIDDQVKVNGQRVEPGEIEAALAAHPGVGAAVVRLHGEHSGRLAAWLVPALAGEGTAARPPDAAGARAWLAERLPAHMIPAAFVPLPAIPLTANGKLDVRALPEPRAEHYARGTTVAPRTGLEAELCDIWREVLDVDRLGVTDSFFDLGGDSLRAVALAGRLRAEGYDAGVADVFASRTVAGLAGLLTGRDRVFEGYQPVEPFAVIDVRDRALLPPDAADAYPLTQNQIGMAVELLADTDRHPYHMVHSFPVPDDRGFEPALLRQAADRIAERHEVLRTSIHLSGYSVPMQVVHQAVAIPVGVADVCVLPEPEAVAVLQDYAAAERDRPFDLESAPLLRIHVHVRPDAWWITFTQCHAITEGWSYHLVLMELLELYNALRDGREPDLAPPPAVRFADTVAAELAAIAEPGHAAYWSAVLADHVPLTLPGLGEPEGGRPEPVHGRVPFADLADRLRALASASDASLKAVLHAAHLKVMSQLTSEPAFHSGLVLDTRVEELGADRVAGMYVNTLPFPMDRTARTWRELVRQVFVRQAEASAHRRYPMPLIQRAAGTRLVHETFNYLDYRHVDDEVLDTGRRISLAPVETGIDMTVHSRGDSLHFISHSHAVSEASMERLAEMYRAVLESMAADFDGDARSAFLPGGEDALVLKEWALTPGSADADAVAEPVLTAFERQAATAPDQVAVTVRGRSGAALESLTYADLDARANRLAHRLLAAGVGAGSVVAVWLPRSADLLVAFLAAWKAGASYLPIDAATPAARVAGLVADAEAAALVTDVAVEAAQAFEAARQAAPVLPPRAEADQWPDTAPERREDPDAAAYVIYTSGSTGVPKGVVIGHRALAGYVHWAVADYLTGPGGAALFSSVAFDLVVTTLWAPLSAGRSVQVFTEDVDLADLGAALTAAAPFAFLKLTPSHLEVLAAQPVAPGLTRTLVVGGEALPTAPALAWLERLGPGARVINEYGPTEATVGNAVFAMTGPVDAATVPIGRPVPGTCMYVLDQDMRPVPVGVAGELFIGGAHLADGYLRSPALTAGRFVPDPFGAPGSRLYRTGDLVRWRADGQAEYLGRRDDQVKIRGHRVEPGEAEAVLRSHPDVKDCAVVARDDGFGARLVAYVVPAAESFERLADLAGWLAERLPDHLVPAAWVPLARIPLTANGKQDRRALPAPEQDASDAGDSRVAPRNDLEAELCAQWCRVLGRDEVGVTDSFFDLGGDSLRAVALVGRLRAAGHDATVADVFQARTVEALAALLAGRAAGAAGGRGVEPFALIGAADRAALPADAADAYPLTQNQIGMLVETLADAERGAYHMVHAFPVPDPVPFDAAVLQDAADRISLRHETLRTSIHLTGYSTPMQIVHSEARIPIAVEDVRALTEQEAVAALQAHVAAERGTPFDLASAPLLRIHVHVRQDAWWLTLTQSHALTEGWSYHLVLEELLDAYHALRANREPEEQESSSVRFADSVAAELAAVEDPAHAAYWAAITAGYTPLGLDGLGDPGAGPDGGSAPVHGQVPFGDLADRLRAVASASDASLKAVLHAAHLKVMSQLTEADAFHSGLTLDTRVEELGADRVAGMYVNTVPFPMDRGARTWRELVRQVFAREAEIWPHRRYPMPLIQRAAGTRLVRVYFTYLDYHAMDAQAVQTGYRITSAPVDAGIDLTVHSRGDRLYLTGRADAVGTAAMTRVTAMFRAVLEAMAADADGDARITYLPAGEAERLLGAGSQDPAVGESGGTLLDVFAARVPVDSDAAAVTAAGSTLTYGELDQRTNRLAHRLLEVGAGPERLVGVCLERDASMIPGLLGVLKSGSGYLPLDPTAPGGRSGAILADAGAVAVVTIRALEPAVRGFFDGPVVVLDDPREAERLVRLPASAPAVALDPENLAYSIYTSGSTGVPKGVRVTHRNVVRLLSRVQEHYAFDESDVVAMVHNYAFDVSVFEIWAALAHGARLVLVDSETARSPEDFLGLLADQEVTILAQTPSAFRSLVAAARDGDPRLRELSLRAVVLAGEKLDVASLAPWVERRSLTRTALVNMYGPTETTVYTTYHRLTRRDFGAGEGASIGRPLGDLRAYVLDDESRLVPAGVAGELCVAGPGVARGYRSAAMTAERFVPDPFGEPGSRMYRTGDLVRRRDDGTLDFLGRRDGQVKIRGHRVELGEIETVLGAHPELRDCAVLARDDDGSGARLVAYVVPTVGAAVPSAADLRSWADERLPAYMVPAVYVPLAEIPLTPNGKQDRAALPAPGAENLRSGRGYVAPRTPAEAAIAEIWQSELGVERVGVQDMFFDIGGDSIRTVGLVGAMRAAGFEVTVPDVFAYRTIATLAEHVGQRGDGLDAGIAAVEPFALIGAADRALLPQDAADAYPMTYNQIGMLVEMLAREGRQHYHVVNAVGIGAQEPFDEDALRGALAELIARHDILRTAFDLETYSVPMQVVHAAAAPRLVVHDATGIAQTDEREYLAARFEAETDDPIDHREAPQQRVIVYRLAGGRWQVVFSQSHAILDGWSLHRLRVELLDRYRALRDGRESSSAPAVGVRFADQVAAELRALESEQDQRYWQDLVAGHAKFVLPGWGDSGAVARESYRHAVDFADLLPGLRDLASTVEVPLKSVLLSAHLKVLSQLTDEPRFFSGLMSHVRVESAGADRVVGMSLNPLPFPFDRRARTWGELVGRTFGDEARAWAHRHYPMQAIRPADGGRLLEAYFSYIDIEQSESGAEQADLDFDFSSNEFPLMVTVAAGRLAFTTDTRTVSRGAAERLAAMYRAVLESMAAGVDGDARAAYLPAGEAAWLREAGSGEPVEPEPVLVPEAIAQRAAQNPEAVAVVCGAESLTFAALVGRADRIGAAAGVGEAPQAPVAVVLDRGPDLLAAFLGVWRAGGAYLPLDPATPAERLGRVLADAGVRVVVTQTAHAAMLAEVFGGRLVVVDDGLPETTALPPTTVAPDSVAYVIYTSGSTGTPKGVQVTHAGLANHLHAAARLFSSGHGGAPLFSSVAFDLVLPQLWVPPMLGRTVHLMPAERGLDELGSWLAEAGPFAFVKLTPSHLRLLAGHPAAADLTEVLVVAGEPFPAELARGWGETLVINEYGPTEATVGTCVHPVTTRPTTGIVPIGRPLPGMAMYVLDEWMQPAPVGVAGELYAGGAGVARGYLDDPALTARQFLPDPFGPPGARLYRTGDRARWLPEGAVEFLGRRDGQVKIRGHRIEVGEIEAVLGGHPAVRDAAVAVRDSGSGPALVAFTVSAGELAPDPGSLRTWLGRQLPDFMVPQVFATLSELPLNANGKVDRLALAGLAAAATEARRPVPPATATEKTLARIFGEVLGTALVGVEHTFHELGAHSLLIVQAVAAARREGLPLTLTLLYRNDTIRSLAAALDSAATADASATSSTAALDSRSGTGASDGAVGQDLVTRDPAAPTAVPGSSRRSGPVPRGLDVDAVLAVMRVHHVPAAQIATLRGGELTALHAFGHTTPGGEPVDDRTVFPAGSISKHLTALTVLRLVDAGVLTLDGDIAEHLAGWTIPGAPGAPITVRHLLSHTSGLRQVAGGRYPRGTELPSLAGLVHAKAEREKAPGAGFRKAGVNFWLLQHAVENVTGEPFHAGVSTLVLEPLGLTDTSFRSDFPEARRAAPGHDHDGSPVPGGWETRLDAAAAGLWTTAADLAAVAAAVRRSWLGRPRSLLAESTAAAMLTEAAPGSFFGLGTVLDTVAGRHWFGHGGELPGHRAMTMCEANTGDGYVVLTNGTNGDHVIRCFTTTADSPGSQ